MVSTSRSVVHRLSDTNSWRTRSTLTGDTSRRNGPISSETTGGFVSSARLLRTENRLLILFAPFAEVFPHFDATTAVGDLLEVFVVTVVVTVVVIRRFRLDHILTF